MQVATILPSIQLFVHCIARKARPASGRRANGEIVQGFVFEVQRYGSAPATGSPTAIFVVLLAQPWATLLTIMTERMQLDSFLLNMAVMLAGIVVNSWIIYKIVSLFSHRGK